MIICILSVELQREGINSDRRKRYYKYVEKTAITK